MQMPDYQLRFSAPFAVIGICCDESAVISADYLPRKTPPLPPQNYLAAEVAKQLCAYLANPRHCFDVPLYPAATAHQQKARRHILQVPSGKTATYKTIAALINSSPRAIGGACRANAVPLMVPCHRIVATNGIGGFGGGKRDMPQMKKWLLRHEGAKWMTMH